MRPLSMSVGVVALMFGAQGFAANVHEPPLGFITTDVSPERWAQLNPENRFKGKVGDALRFEQIQALLRICAHYADDLLSTREIPPPAGESAGVRDDAFSGMSCTC